MEVRMNPDFGPAWEVIDNRGRVVAAAHDRADAKAFAEGRMTAGELRDRNMLFESDKKED